MNNLRLDKAINDITALGRKEVKNLIKNGSVIINGEIIKDPSFKFDVESSEIIINGKKENYSKY